MEHTGQGKDLELILTVKIETRHPVGGSFGSEFSTSVVIVELWRPEVARLENFVSNFVFFLEKRPLMVTFSKFCSESLHSYTDGCFLFKCHNICLMGNQWNRALFTSPKKQNFPASQTVTTARMTLKICQGQPQTFSSHCSRFHPNRFTFGRVIAKRVKAVFLPNTVFSW